MGKHDRIKSEDGLPLRRFVSLLDDGTEHELWIPDTSDPEVQAALRAEAKALESAPSYWEDIAWIEAVQADTLKHLD
jgi:surface antigen